MILNVYSGCHLLIGDLNQLESDKQKQGGSQKIPQGRWFKNWTIRHNLSEIPFKGAPFTWINNREGKDLIFERLDRAYGNHGWKDLYPNASGCNFPIFLSDHGLIALDTHPSNAKRKRPYRLEAWCYNKEKIKEITSNSGKNKKQGSKMFTLQRRLETIRTKCMKWCLNYNKEAGLNWASIKDQLERNNAIDSQKMDGEKRKIKEKWAYWRQRAKSKWDDWGDQSTGFFFRSVKTRATKNEIRATKARRIYGWWSKRKSRRNLQILQGIDVAK
ncbi:Acylcarnitine hydrolase [Bienertia sinuspersici]